MRRYHGSPVRLRKTPVTHDGNASVAETTSTKSSFYAQLVEHVFISEVLQEAWFGYGHTVEVLRSEVDASGYDVVFECNGVLRHVQLKSLTKGGKRSDFNVNSALCQKPGGCVVVLERDEDQSACRVNLSYLFFGGAPGKPLPSLESFKIGKHSKGDATGKKKERPAIRLVPKSRFDKLDNARVLVQRLFGLDVSRGEYVQRCNESAGVEPDPMQNADQKLWVAEQFIRDLGVWNQFQTVVNEQVQSIGARRASKPVDRHQ